MIFNPKSWGNVSKMETYFKIVEFIEKRGNPILACNYRPLKFTPYIYVNVNPVIGGVQILLKPV